MIYLMMKTKLSYIIVLIFCLDLSLQAQNTKSNLSEIINLIDSTGKKQGQWIILGKDKPGTCYGPSKKVSEGKYLNNRKTGIWIEYYCNGNIKNNITFNDGRPQGPAKMYYENGKIDEEGSWLKNRWVGEYKKYSQDGKLLHVFTFDENGKRKDSASIYQFNLGDFPDRK